MEISSSSNTNKLNEKETILNKLKDILPILSVLGWFIALQVQVSILRSDLEAHKSSHQTKVLNDIREVTGLSTNQLLQLLTIGNMNEISISQLSGTILLSQLPSGLESKITSINTNLLVGELPNRLLPRLDSLEGQLAQKHIPINFMNIIPEIPTTKIIGLINSNNLNIQFSQINGVVTPDMIDSLPASKLSGKLVHSQIDTVSTASFLGQISSDQIINIDSSKISGLITTNQITGVIHQENLPEIPAFKLPILPLDKLPVLTNDKLPILDTGKLPTIPIELLPMIPNERIANISASKILMQITDDQIETVNSSKIIGTLTKQMVPLLYDDNLFNLSSNKLIGSIPINQVLINLLVCEYNVPGFSLTNGSCPNPPNHAEGDDIILHRGDKVMFYQPTNGPSWSVTTGFGDFNLGRQSTIICYDDMTLWPNDPGSYTGKVIVVIDRVYDDLE
jgi:hypothetical protein